MKKSGQKKEKKSPQQLPGRELFEQLPTESAKAFQAFRIYCDLGPQRSMREVAEKLGKNAGGIEIWSAKHDWVNRVRSWDDFQHAKVRVSEDDAIAAEARKRAKAAFDLNTKYSKAAQLMVETGMRILAYPTTKRIVKDGGAIVHIHPQSFSMGDGSRLISTAHKIDRLANGMATDKTEIVGQMATSPIEAVDIESLDLDDETLQKVLDAMRRQKQIRAAQPSNIPDKRYVNGEAIPE